MRGPIGPGVEPLGPGTGDGDLLGPKLGMTGSSGTAGNGAL